MEIQTRLGKMHYKHAKSQHGNWTDYIQVPWLNLSGQWLQKAGFPVGEPIVIKVSKNKLVITKIKTEKNECANSERKKYRRENTNSKSREDEIVGVSEADFTPGDCVEVTVEKKLLVLRCIKKNSEKIIPV